MRHGIIGAFKILPQLLKTALQQLFVFMNSRNLIVIDNHFQLSVDTGYIPAIIGFAAN